MSLISWLPSKKMPAPAVIHAESSGPSHMKPTRPMTSGRRLLHQNPTPARNAQPANRKGERMSRRELLYAVVRESMGRAGVLSASYKFKVLSLDARGRQFLVMIDLARGHGGETDRLAEIEAVVAQSAKARYDILVTAVYWRMNEHVAVGLPSARLTRTTHSRPAALESQPALSPTATWREAARYEPIQADT